MNDRFDEVYKDTFSAFDDISYLHQGGFRQDWDDNEEQEDKGDLEGDEEEGLTCLRNVDYTLNSPIILDELTDLMQYLRSGIRSVRFDNAKFDVIKSKFPRPINGYRQCRDPNDMHTLLGELSSYTTVNDRCIRKVINDATRSSHQTFPIVSAFLKSWIGKEMQNPKCDNIPDEIVKYGELYLEMHYLVLLLNSNSEEERKSISMLCTVTTICPIEGIFSISLPTLGEFIIYKNILYWKNKKFFLDRNIALMFKDVWSARFQTGISMIHRVDSIYKPDDWEILYKIYNIGDDILIQGRNIAFDALKLIEPICSQKLVDLAQENRPLIPPFTAFPEHLNRSVEEVLRFTPTFQHLVDEINKIQSHHLVLAIYGSFRHWGHPYIEYLEGLDRLYTQVNLHKVIDTQYANILASDMAFLVLQKMFKKNRKWYVDIKRMNKKHILYNHVRDQTWPTPHTIKTFGNNWHSLPIVKCFDIPDLIDPSLIYSDKSHSMTRTEVMSYINSGKSGSIPAKKVLQTLLHTPCTNWRLFLQIINDQGLPLEDLIIGLKAKERELKRFGRFFSLMSWKLREYFVVTEYLIKTHYVPLFSGLTMADDLTTVIKKMMDNTSGQGLESYDLINISNHFDYEKWNNHQRGASTNPTFKVMGQFLGLPNIFVRTHEFFEKSLIYYNERPDLMKVEGQTIINKTNTRVCWNGQLGGLEGLRQKGWSILNLLVIRREGLRRNTKIQVLAQGDNQVVCTNYKVQKWRTHLELNNSLLRIIKNNQEIVDSISEGANKLGLIINRDETIQSTDFLIYGKIPVFRGNICSLEAKRWSRIACVSNDQLPTISNLMGTVSSSALSVAHYSSSPINTIIHYNFIANFVRILIELHDPAIRGAIRLPVETQKNNYNIGYKIATLYIDPSLGGASGVALTRFLIRMFPDPITESLVMWKQIHNYLPEQLKYICKKAGNPILSPYEERHFSKLLEDPLSLNLEHTSSPLSAIKKVVKLALYKDRNLIANEIIRDAIEYTYENETKLINYLMSVKPLFPRFLSEFKSASYLGITTGLVNLFENSRTLRTCFKKKLSGKVSQLIHSSELKLLNKLVSYNLDNIPGCLWVCSSSKADALREISWGQKVYGATVPHPFELIRLGSRLQNDCIGCNLGHPFNNYISVLIPNGLVNYESKRGPFKAYLGSKTSDSTGVYQPWEKETVVPLLTRAVNLRKAIFWFVDPGTSLANSILDNIKSMTGEDWSESVNGFNRTGSALHRFACSRQSSGGYIAQSPMKLTHMTATTDSLHGLQDKNYDFMHQALLIYAQVTAGELHTDDSTQGIYHFHIACERCIREIDSTLKLNTNVIYTPPNVVQSVLKWKPSDSSWSKEKIVKQPITRDWESYSIHEKQHSIGRVEGFLYGYLEMIGKSDEHDLSIFPFCIVDKLNPYYFLRGLVDGLIRVSIIFQLTLREVRDFVKPSHPVLGLVLKLIDHMVQNPYFLNLARASHFQLEFSRSNYKIPPSYPACARDVGLSSRYYLESLAIQWAKNRILYDKDYNSLPIFSDIIDNRLIALYDISEILIQLFIRTTLTQSDINKLRSFKNLVHYHLDDELVGSNESLSYPLKYVVKIESEIRHAVKFLPPFQSRCDSLSDHTGPGNHTWGKELVCKTHFVEVPYRSYSENYKIDIAQPRRIQCPLISGLRTFQCATGSHYKLRSIINEMGISYHDVIAAGDGSGGIGSMLLRHNKRSRLIYNSLFSLSGVDLKGVSPSPPSAIDSIDFIRGRCVNLKDSWCNPNDLSDVRTWEYFLNLKTKFSLNIDLMTMDMEFTEDPISERIESCLASYINKILNRDGVLIYKTYTGRILENQNLLRTVGTLFSQVYLSFTEATSSFSSELYIVMRGQSQGNLFGIPDLNEIKNFILRSPAFGTNESEFSRAREFYLLNRVQGVPISRSLSAPLELSHLVESMGLSHNTGAEVWRIGEWMLSTTFPGIDLAECLLIFLLRRIFRVKGPSVRSILPPTDNDTLNGGVLLTGYLFWRSMYMNDLSCFTCANRLISEYIIVNWEDKVIELKENGKSHQFKLRKIYFRNFPRTPCKILHLDSKMAAVGQVIRIFDLMFPKGSNNKFEPLKSTESRELIWSTIYPGCDWKSINNYISFSEVLKKEQIRDQLMEADWDSETYLPQEVCEYDIF